MGVTVTEIALATTPGRSYPCRVERVVDGDTLHLLFDLGFGVAFRACCRLARIDAPELKSPEGEKARDWLKGIAENCGPDGFEARVGRQDAYGRWLVELAVRAGGVNVNDLALRQGYAKPFGGK